MSDASPMAGKGLLDRLPWYAVPALLVGIPLLAAVAVQVEPSLYDEVVWHYYWGPIKADAHDDLERCLPTSGPDIGDGEPGFAACKSAGGVVARSGYNVVNTLSWALLLGICIVGAAQMLRRLRTPMGNRLIVGASAWVVAGSIFHVAEDVGTFRAPLQYLFITPTIYLLFAAFGILAFLVGHYLKWVAERAGLARALEKLWFLHAILVLAWLVIWLQGWDQVAVIVHPLWVAAFAAITFLVTRRLVMKAGRVDPATLTLSLSLGTFLLAVLYVVKFADHPWGSPGLAQPWSFDWGIANPGADPSMPLAFLYAPLLALGVALAVRGVALARFVKGRSAAAAAYLLPINLFLVFSQMLDAFSTALGIDLAGYHEKHVLSAKVIDATRNLAERIGFGWGAEHATFLGFVPLKLLVSLLVIYAIDVRSKEDQARYPDLIGLVRFAIIMVGLGPGVRDFVRLSLGV